MALLVFALHLMQAEAQGAVPVVMLSDVHFDPFQDPAKVDRLLKAAPEQWQAILNEAASPTRDADVHALQSACGSHALDTGWSLFRQTLAAAHTAEPHPLFVTLSGDLLTHEFPCRLRHLAATASTAQAAEFAAKTVAFVLLELQATYPGVPVYAALGNNDSPCGDYRESLGDPFLQAASAVLARAAHVSAATVSPEGDYSVALPAPIEHGRLLVVQDIFAGRAYAGCNGAADRSPETAQISWLRTQLQQARRAGEHVWVMSHMPPGVDVFNSFRAYVLRPAELCAAPPRTYLADASLSDTLLDFSDAVRLAVFGHTHMDDMRVLHRDADTGKGGGATVPAKLVPSVSPYAGNHPAFLLASVDPHTAWLKDWRTFVSPELHGAAAPWAESYRYTRLYGEPNFSSNAAMHLSDKLLADKTGQAAESSAFRHNFFPGDLGLYALGLAQIWPAYACSLRHMKPDEVQRCICAAGPQSTGPSEQRVN